MTDLTLPDSLWAATAAPAPDCPPLEGSLTSSVVVVGAGFTGLSAALHLAEAGVDVMVLEAGEPGWGASGRNGGQVIPGLKLDRAALIEKFGAERGARFFTDSGTFADLVFDLIDRHAIDCQHHRKGWLQPAHGAAGMRTLERRVGEWADVGARVELLDGPTAAGLIGSDYHAGAMLDRRGGGLNPLSYARGLAHAAIKAGARIHGGSMVTALKRTASGWEVRCARGSVRADTVILATNAYTEMAGTGGPTGALAKSVIPLFSYQIASKPLSDNVRRSILPQGHVASDTRRLLAYFRIDPEGRLIMGGRGAMNGNLAPENFRYVRRLVAEMFPQVGSFELAHSWNGQVAMTLDHVPHRHELAPGLIAGLGFNGRGVTTATAMGRDLAAMAQRRGMHGDEEDAQVFPLSSARAIPFHSLRAPVIALAARWKGWLDKREHAGV